MPKSRTPPDLNSVDGGTSYQDLNIFEDLSGSGYTLIVKEEKGAQRLPKKLL